MQWHSLLAALFLVAIIGWADHVTGWEVNLFMAYSLPIVLVVWKVGWRTGLVFALFCSATWWLARFEKNPYQDDFEFALAVFTQLFYFSVLVVATSTIKNLRLQEKARTERLERAQVLERRLLQASEREQQRIGRDLHDSLGPQLAAIGYAAIFLANDLRHRDQPEAAQAEQIRELVSDAITLTRELARGIFPFQMDGSGLSIALAELVGTTARLTNRSISLCETGEILVDDPEQGMHLYRIAQEALKNAVKHSDAQKITVFLTNNENMLRLAVDDNGKGMGPSPTSTQGMGMQSMRYRARLLGGDLMINTIPGEGTIVSCEILNWPPAKIEPAT